MAQLPGIRSARKADQKKAARRSRSGGSCRSRRGRRRRLAWPEVVAAALFVSSILGLIAHLGGGR